MSLFRSGKGYEFLGHTAPILAFRGIRVE
jgi:hypothetical protein